MDSFCLVNGAHRTVLTPPARIAPHRTPATWPPGVKVQACPEHTPTLSGASSTSGAALDVVKAPHLWICDFLWKAGPRGPLPATKSSATHKALWKTAPKHSGKLAGPKGGLEAPKPYLVSNTGYTSSKTKEFNGPLPMMNFSPSQVRRKQSQGDGTSGPAGGLQSQWMASNHTRCCTTRRKTSLTCP